MTGMKYPFSSNPDTIFDSNFNTGDQGFSDLLHYLLTGKRERMFRSNIGLNILAKLFEKNVESNIELIRAELLEEIKNNITGIDVLSVDFMKNDDEKVIIIKLTLLKQGEEIIFTFGINSEQDIIYTAS